MIYTIVFKTPDVLDQLEDQNIPEDEMEKIKKIASRQITYGEYIGVHIDTEKNLMYI